MFFFVSVVDTTGPSTLGCFLTESEAEGESLVDELYTKLLLLSPQKNNIEALIEPWPDTKDFELDRWYPTEEAKSLGIVTYQESENIYRSN